MRNDVIKLITKYPEGKTVTSINVEVFAEKKSLNRSEFYASYSAGLKAAYIFEVDPEDYALAYVISNNRLYQASHIEYGGNEYEIIRSYCKSFNSMELTVGNGKRN